MPDSLRETLDHALGAQYTIQRLLGRGGMGAVYLALDRSLERLVAIKVLSPDTASAPTHRERFRREARIAAQLSHPNIVPLFAYGEVEDLWYYVMGYVPGESLAERLAFEGPLPCESVRRILAELGGALDYAHRHGVIHRDVKPENVLLDDESGRAMLADFGVAKSADALERLSVTGFTVGTPYYMSPEQALGSAELDGRSDIYSLGVLAYVMLTGREPFAGGDLQQVALSHVTRDPPRLLDVAPHTPADLAAAVVRCLARDPADRWPNGHSLRDAIGYDEATETAPPSELRDIPSFGTLAVVWALSWAAVAVTIGRSAAERWVCALVALLVPFGLFLDVLTIKRPGLRTRDILRVSFWPPMWWGLWWPRALRRRGDVWDRLPRIARWTRTAITVALVGAPLLILLAHARLPSALDAARARNSWWFAAAETGLLTMLLTTFAAVVWWGRRRGLRVLDMVRLVHGPTIISTSWTASPVAQVLAPPRPKRAHRAQPETPQELLRAVCEVAQGPSDMVGLLGRDVAASARRLVGAIERLDAEIASLDRDADVSEIARLEARLAASAQGATRATEEHHEFRTLLLGELDVLRRLRMQHDLAATRRAHLVELLRRLWTLLAGGGSPSGAPGQDLPRGHERLRALIAQVNDQVDDGARSSQLEVSSLGR